jgi:hypothetical protein
MDTFLEALLFFPLARESLLVVINGFGQGKALGAPGHRYQAEVLVKKCDGTRPCSKAS